MVDKGCMNYDHGLPCLLTDHGYRNMVDHGQLSSSMFNHGQHISMVTESMVNHDQPWSALISDWLN